MVHAIDVLGEDGELACALEGERAAHARRCAPAGALDLRPGLWEAADHAIWPAAATGCC